MAREVVPQAAAELHLVGQPQGPRAATTCSRAASSASTTSASSTAARRCRRAATSSRPTAPPGWRCSARTCSRSPPSWPRAIRPTRTCASSSSSTSSGSPSRWTMPATTSGMWDEEDGFFYDVLRLPDGQAERLKVRSMVGLLPLCAVTVFDGTTCWRAARRSGEQLPAVPRSARPELRASIHDPVAQGVRRPAAGLGPRRDQAPPRAGEDARRERVPEPATGSGRSRATTPSIPTSFAAGGQEYRVGYLPAESDTRDVRRQLELARADLDAGQRPDRPRAAAVLPLLRRRLHSSARPARAA